VNAIYAQIAGAQPLNDGSGAFELPCSSSIQIGFQFSGQNYMMDPSDFIIQQQGDACIGALIPMDMPDDHLTELVWILGALFMKNVVSVFDLGAPAVGFGRLKATNYQYGSYTVVGNNEATALGTGPSATLSPTFTPAKSALTNMVYANFSCTNDRYCAKSGDSSSWNGTD
jgi:Eukaryotic aspartyl protease